MRVSGCVRLALLAAILVCAIEGMSSPVAQASEYTLTSRFGGTGSEAGRFLKPQGVAVDSTTHDVYVDDSENHRIEKFDSSGAFIAAWGWGVSDGVAQSEVCTSGCQAGLPGAGSGQLTTPTYIAVDNSSGPSKGEVYVGDRGDNVVKKFSASGAYLASFTEGTGGAFQLLEGVSVDGAGNLWVYDGGGEVYEFTNTGLETQQWNIGFGTGPGLTVDAKGDVYVVRGCSCVEKFLGSGLDQGEFDTKDTNTAGLAADIANHNIFSNQGTFIARYDEPSTLPTSPSTTFGKGSLTSAAGVGVDEGTRNVYVSDTSNNEVYVFLAPPSGPPNIKRVYTGSVSSNAAIVHLKIDSDQFDTRYHIEYGTTKSYGNAVPATDVDIGSGLEEVTKTQIIKGLSPKTTYHYRVVAANSRGAVSGGDLTFTTFSPVESLGLPDGRVYELVSPPDKNSGNIAFQETLIAQATLDGEAMTYSSFSSFGGSQSGKPSQYLSKRGPDGWSTQAIMPPEHVGGEASLSSPYVGFSNDLSMGVLAWEYATLTPEATVGDDNLYVRDNSDGSYRLITENASLKGSRAHFVGASLDYSHIVFESEDTLSPEAASSARNVYMWTNGSLSVASIPSGSSTGAPGAVAGNGTEDAENAVSSDGRLVFWAYQGGLYVRKDGVETIKINASERNPSSGDGLATFDGATSDGEWVFFSDETALTDATDDKGGLYEFNTTSGKLKLVTPDESSTPELRGIAGFGEDGAYVYFVAGSSLETVATAGPKAVVGQPNLYVTHGKDVTFIATLSSGDSNDWAQNQSIRDAMVTPDGAHIVFMSSMSLTGYDNGDAVGGSADSEVFIYDAGAAGPTCVSCNTSGASPIGPSSLPRLSQASGLPRYLSSNGNRLFFNSGDALTLRDTNSMQDVYEWERSGSGDCVEAGGCVYLISSGTSPSSSSFAAAGSTGGDVFFATRSQLVAGDIDENIDIYDARVDGGFPVVAPSEPAQCSDEACLGPLSAPPSTPTALTELPAGSGAGKDPPHRSSTFKVRPISRRAMRKLVRTGRLTLAVTVSGPGEVWATMTAKLNGRFKRLAASSTVTRRAGGLRLKLILGKRARNALAKDHLIGVRVAVRYSRTTSRRSVTVIANRSGSMG